MVCPLVAAPRRSYTGVAGPLMGLPVFEVVVLFFLLLLIAGFAWLLRSDQAAGVASRGGPAAASARERPAEGRIAAGQPLPAPASGRTDPLS